MAAYEPPSTIYSIFDVLAFTEPNSVTLTEEVAEQRYVTREEVASSIATTTQFSGAATAPSFVGDYSTNSTTTDQTHYLHFSDSSSTGTGLIQKNAGLFFNPSANPLTAGLSVNNGLTIPTGPILGRNDTGANTFDGTNPYATHPIGWTIKLSKVVSTFASGASTNIIADGTPSTEFTALSNGVWRFGCTFNNVSGNGNVSTILARYNAVGGTIINAFNTTSAGSDAIYHRFPATLTGATTFSYSWPEIDIRYTGNGVTNINIGFQIVYTVQPTMTFNIWAIKVA